MTIKYQRELSRRELLGALGVGAGAAAFLGIRFFKNYQSSSSNEPSPIKTMMDAGPDKESSPASTELEFDFLVREKDNSLETLIPVKVEEELIKISTPVTDYVFALIPEEDKLLVQDYIDTEWVKSALNEFGSSVTNVAIGLALRSRYRVIPEPNPEFAKQYREYCRFATEFLFNREEFRALWKPSIDWLLSGETKPNQEIPAYICHSYVTERQVEVKFTLQDGRIIPRTVPVLSIHEGAKLIGVDFISDRNTEKTVPQMGPYTIIVGTSNFGALQKPFSEVTPLLFLEGTKKYAQQRESRRDDTDYIAFAQKVMSDIAIIGETIEESVSIYLTTLIIQEPRMRRALHYTSAQKLEREGLELAENEIYKDVPKAYRFLKDHGLEHTVNLFMDDPSEYLRRIQRV